MRGQTTTRAILVLLLIPGLAGCFGPRASEPDLPWNVSQASGQDDQFPTLAGGILVWEGGRGDQARVFIADANLAQPRASRLSSVESVQMKPTTDGSGIVWMDGRNKSADGNWEIRYRNAATGAERVLSNGTGEYTFPVIDGKWVAWVEWDPVARTRNLHVYDMDEGRVVREFAGENLRYTNPVLDRGRILVVEDASFREGAALDELTLLVIDVETGARTEIPWWENVGTRLATGAYDLDGNRVVWEQIQEDPDPAERARRFFMHDLATKERRELTLGGPARSNPSLDGARLAWSDSEGKTFSIYYGDFDGRSFARLSPNTLLATMPSADAGRVAFVSAGRSGDAEIFLWRS